MCSFNLLKYMDDIIKMNTKEPTEIDILQLKKLQRQVNNSREQLAKNADNILPSNMQKVPKVSGAPEKTVRIVSPKESPSDELSNMVQSQPENIIVHNNTNNTIGLLGFQLPKTTFYLIIALIIIGGILWYMSIEPKQKKKKDNEEEDD